MQAGVEEKKERQWCLTCFRSEKVCLCPWAKPQDTKNRFVILMHPLEFKNQKTGTGRMSHLGLTKSEILVGVDFTKNERLNTIIEEESPVLLYPGENAVNLSLKKPENSQNKTVILIDSTWPCAKKVLRLSKNLHQLPRVCFSSKKQSEFKIKQQPFKDCLSTIEAISSMIEVFQTHGLENSSFDHEQFLKPFYQMMDWQISCAENPNLGGYRRKPYKDVNIRRDPKKRRKLYHD